MGTPSHYVVGRYNLIFNGRRRELPTIPTTFADIRQHPLASGATDNAYFELVPIGIRQSQRHFFKFCLLRPLHRTRGVRLTTFPKQRSTWPRIFGLQKGGETTHSPIPLVIHVRPSTKRLLLEQRYTPTATVFEHLCHTRGPLSSAGCDESTPPSRLLLSCLCSSARCVPVMHTAPPLSRHGDDLRPSTHLLLFVLTALLSLVLLTVI